MPRDPNRLDAVGAGLDTTIVRQPPFVTTAIVRPAFASQPTITGTLSVGSTLNVTTGEPSGSPSSITYQWRRGGNAILNATASSYAIAAGDVGYRLDCIVTATNAAGSTSERAYLTLPVGGSGGTPTPTPAPTLGALTLAGTLTADTAAAGVTISGATDGSSIALSISGLTVSGSGATRTVSGTPATSGTLSATETLAGATGSPRTAAIGTVQAPAAYSFVNSEAAALYARDTTIAPNDTRKQVVDNLIGTLKAGPTSGSNIWAKLDVFQPYAGASASAALLNWKGTSFTATLGGAPVFVADRGFYCDGADDYVDSGFAPSAGVQFTQDSASVGAWFRKVDANPNTPVGTIGSTSITLNPRNSSNAPAARINTTTAFAGDTRASGYGLTVASRVTGPSSQLYVNGAASGSPSTQTSAARNSGNIAAGRAASAYADGQYCAVIAGAGLTAAENADLYSALSTYMTALGVAAPTSTTATRSLTSAVTLPDGGSGSAAGKGWTNTGLVRIGSDDTYLVGDNGDITGGAETVAPAVVHWSRSSNALLRQWTVASLGITGTWAGLQGVSWEPVGTGGVRGIVYFVLIPTSGANLLYRFPVNDDWSAGAATLVGSQVNMNDIAFDAGRGILWMLTNGSTATITQRSKADLSVVTGTGTITLPGTGGDYDMISYAADLDSLIISNGPNGSNGRVDRYSLSGSYGGPRLVESITLTGATEIEGVERLSDGTFVVCNDSYRHGGGAAFNRMLTFAP